MTNQVSPDSPGRTGPIGGGKSTGQTGSHKTVKELRDAFEQEGQASRNVKENPQMQNRLAGLRGTLPVAKGEEAEDEQLFYTPRGTVSKEILQTQVSVILNLKETIASGESYAERAKARLEENINAGKPPWLLRPSQNGVAITYMWDGKVRHTNLTKNDKEESYSIKLMEGGRTHTADIMQFIERLKGNYAPSRDKGSTRGQAETTLKNQIAQGRDKWLLRQGSEGGQVITWQDQSGKIQHTKIEPNSMIRLSNNTVIALEKFQKEIEENKH